MRPEWTDAELYVATIGRPAKSDTGAQTHVRTFLEYAGRHGIAARLLTPFGVAGIFVQPVMGISRLTKMVGTAPWAWWYQLGRQVLLREDVRRTLRPDVPAIIYAQDLVSAEAALDIKEKGYPVEVVLIVHSAVSQADEWAENGYIRPAGRLYRGMARNEARILPRVDRLVFPSDFVARGVHARIAETVDVPSWRIPNCVFRTGASAAPVSKPADLLSIGPLVPNKNHEFLIRVLAEAHRMGFRYRLTIVGAGPLRRALRTLAAELGVQQYVSLPGYVPNAARLLPDSRAYVHAAKLENCCMAVLEALAAGRPVLAAPSGGIPEQVTDGVEGFYWDFDDPGMAAHRLIRLLQDPVMYARMARAARARYTSQFAPDSVMPRLLDALLGPSHRMAFGGAPS